MTLWRVIIAAIAAFVGFLLLLQLGIDWGESSVGVVPQ